MAASGSLYFPIRLRCADSAALLHHPALVAGVARALSRAFSNAQSALPAAIALGDGVHLRDPEVTKGDLSDNEESQLLGRLRAAIQKAARDRNLQLWDTRCAFPAAARDAGSDVPERQPTDAPPPETPAGQGIFETLDPRRYDPRTASYQLPSYDG